MEPLLFPAALVVLAAAAAVAFPAALVVLAAAAAVAFPAALVVLAAVAFPAALVVLAAVAFPAALVVLEPIIPTCIIMDLNNVASLMEKHTGIILLCFIIVLRPAID